MSSGTGDWRLTVKSDRTGIEPLPDDLLGPLDLRVLAYMRTRDGFLTALHDLVHDVGHHQVPIFNPGSNVNQESNLRIINTADTTTAVTIRAVDDAGNGGEETVSVTLPGNTVRSISARELEAEGLGDGVGKWRLLVTADNPVGVMSLMYTVSGHLTNLSYLPETERVIAGTLSASFTYTEDDGVPFGIRFNAESSTGDIRRYTWDFGETSRRVEPVPGTGTTSFFGYDDGWSYGVGTRGDTYGYDGRYPHRATYQVTLTATDRHGRSATRTKRVRVTNTLRFPGLRDLIARINDRSGHRGKLVIWEGLGGRTFEDSHAKQTVFSSMGEEGVPAGTIVAPIPDVPKGVPDFLTHPRTRDVRDETLVVNLSVFPAFRDGDADLVPEHNIVFVAAAGNVGRHINSCDPGGSPDRDLWRPGHSFYTCDGVINSGIYRGAMEAIATGKVLYATPANLQQDGSVIPHLRVIKCGDTMAFCFAVPYVRGNASSSATAKLSAAVFHLFQLYENADDVVQALKRCTRDVGEPGIDREFGNGLVDLRCVGATGSVVDR